MKHIFRKSLLLLSSAALMLSGCDKSAAELEELRSELGSLTERVAAIENTQIKALEEQIADIEEEIASLKGSGDVPSGDVSVLEGKITVVSDDVKKLKESVSALDASSKELSEKIKTINTRISQMETKITSILSSIEELKSKVEAAGLTLSYIPKYTDNNERVLYTRDVLAISGTVTLSFIVRPASAAESLAKDWETSLGAIAVSTLTTKAGVGKSLELSVSGASAEDGVLSVDINVDKLDKDFILGKTGAAIALDVTFGGVRKVTDNVNLTPTLEEEAFITYLLTNFDSDGDGKVNADEITKLTITSSYNLTSEALNAILNETPELTTLECSGNKLTSLDVSKNPLLTTLNCTNNNLTSLDLSNNEKLTDVNLTGNSKLTKVVCKSLDWALGCSKLWSDAAALYYLSDGTQIMLDTSLCTVINDKTWKQFNLGARLGNLYGDVYNFSDAQTACPTDWRLPTKNELAALYTNYSAWTTYLGLYGRWFSGYEKYSSSASAIFLPEMSRSDQNGRYWSSEKRPSGDGAYYLFFYKNNVYYSYSGESYKWSVRCLKD